MDAWFARNRLSAYLDGSLPSEEATEVKQLIEADPSLRAELEAMQAAISLVRQHGRLTAPADFHERLMSRLELERPPAANANRFPVRRRLWAGLAAAAVLLITLPAGLWFSATRLAPVERAQVVTNAGPTADALEPTEDAGQVPLAAAAPRSVADEAVHSARALRSQHPEPAPTTRAGHSRVTGLPSDVAYVPSWDQDEEARELIGQSDETQVLAGGVHRRPTANWRITLGSADVLFRLMEITRSAGGELLDGNNRPLDVRELTIEQNSARAQLVVPATRQADVEAALAALGAQETRALGEVADTETVVFRVDVQYEP